MSQGIAYGICISIIILAIKSSIQSTLYTKDIKDSLNRVIYYLSVAVSFLVVGYNLQFIVAKIIQIGNESFTLTSMQEEFFKIAMLAATFLLFEIILYNVLKVIIVLLFRKNKDYKKGNLVFISTFLGIIKGGIIVIVLFTGIIMLNIFVNDNIKIQAFENFKVYNAIEKFIGSNSDFKKQNFYDSIPGSNFIVYYNGITVEEGVKSNKEIDEKAKSLVELFSNNDREKAKMLYAWIGLNIEYDHDKAERTLNNDNGMASGAIAAWESRSGICLDYACLYVAMARAVGLEVRLVTGEGFNGSKYEAHAWNEVYISEEDKWIPVDTTFYISGNYFDNENFYDDHKKEDIIGKW